MLHWVFGTSALRGSEAIKFPPNVTVRQTLSFLGPFAAGSDAVTKTGTLFYRSESQILCAIKSLLRLCWVLLSSVGEWFRAWSKEGTAETPSGPRGKLPPQEPFPEQPVPLRASCAHGPGEELWNAVKKEFLQKHRKFKPRLVWYLYELH